MGKTNREGKSARSLSLDDLKKRVDPRILKGKTSEDFRRPYIKNLEEAKQLQQNLTGLMQRIDGLTQKLYDQEMEELVYPLIDPARTREREHETNAIA